MTSEHTDTAAIRAGSYPIDGMTDSCRGYDEAARFLLCDALDAARAETLKWAWDCGTADAEADVAISRAEAAEEATRLAHITCDKLQAESLDNRARAEAAEAELAEEARNHLDDIRLLQAAEARITAALDQKCRQPHAEGCCGCPVHAALAGGTA